MIHEDVDVVKIRSFVTKCLESIGALVEFTEYDYAEALIPDDFADYFDGQTYFNLSFDFDVARQHEDSEFVTYGSFFLDRVVELASHRGLACKRHIMDEDVEGRTLPQKIKGRIAFRNCRGTFLANAPVIYHYVLFNFKVSYISDEREDRIVKVLVNLNTGHVDDRMLEAIGSVIFTDNPHTSYTVEQMSSIDNAYQAAMRVLEERIQPVIHEINGKIRVRLAGEKKRIIEYYDEIDSELNLKREKLVGTGKDDGIKSIDDKLRLSGIERQRRLNEIEEKNALKVSIMLFSATLISHTKIRNRYRVKRGKVERDIHVVWNPILNDVDPLICEVCGDATLEVEVCSKSHIGCGKCVHTCSVCGAYLCKDCGMTECAVCGDPLCGQCKTVCENCGDVLCGKHVEFCTCKEEERRKAAERERERIRKKQEAAERKRQERIHGFQDIPLQLSNSMKRYFDRYVRENLDALDENWKESLVKAQVAISQDENTKARTTLQKLDQQYPDNVWVKVNLVLSYRGWTHNMMLQAVHAVEMAPKMASAHVALGYANQIHGSFWDGRAVGNYEKAIELAEDDEVALKASAHFQIGKIMYDKDYLRDAAYRWQMALNIDPSFEPAREALYQLRSPTRRVRKARK
jgi:hypothetical protein